MDVARGRAVGEDVVCGLQVEGFLDFGVGGAEEVQEGHCEEEDVYEFHVDLFGLIVIHCCVNQCPWRRLAYSM
ncbi:hypothetical protein V8C26DRAFT_385209 [Trichoderma gracile]